MEKSPQLIINGIQLPFVSNDRYRGYEDELGIVETMADGSSVFEIQGMVWRVSYSCDKLPDDTLRALLPLLRRKQELSVAFVPEGEITMRSAVMFCDSLPTRPSVAFAKAGAPVWHNLAFTLLHGDHDSLDLGIAWEREITNPAVPLFLELFRNYMDEHPDLF